MNYIEEDLREAFKAGILQGKHLQANNYFDAPLDEDEYIKSLNEKDVKEDTIPFLHWQLRNKLHWEDFCNLTGTSYYAEKEGFKMDDYEIVYISKNEAKRFNLI